MSSGGVDRIFLGIVLLLLVVGFFSFASASLGVLTRDGADILDLATSQLLLGLLLGIVAFFAALAVPHRILRRYALFIFLGSLVLSALVFVPGLGLYHGGAVRWIDLGFASFQPAEFLKLGFVIYLASWLAAVRERSQTFRHGTLPFLVLTALAGAVLLAQPDTGTFLILLAAGLAMLVAAGGRFLHIALLGLLAVALVGALAYSRPYVRERLTTFLNPAADPLGSGYQLQQSILAIGSGEIFGRGFGQSVQKFNYLPEPVGDSIFAVFAEEFGFVGSVFLVSLFTAFALRGLRIATRAPDYFGGLLVVGIVILIVSQAFTNIGSMVGVLPLTGVPLVFISHGGTALMTALLEAGIVLSVSRRRS